MQAQHLHHLEKTITGLGYEVWSVVRDRQGVLRVTIDQKQGVSSDDCDRVSRHLRYFLPVAGIDYNRLEVASPGVDRELHTIAHFQRFLGQTVKITLHRSSGRPTKIVGSTVGAQGRSVTVQCEDVQQVG